MSHTKVIHTIVHNSRLMALPDPEEYWEDDRRYALSTWGKEYIKLLYKSSANHYKGVEHLLPWKGPVSFELRGHGFDFTPFNQMASDNIEVLIDQGMRRGIYHNQAQVRHICTEYDDSSDEISREYTESAKVCGIQYSYSLLAYEEDNDSNRERQNAPD